MGDMEGVIEVTAKYSPLAFMYALVKATIEIDGTTVVRGWGTHVLEVAPGTHVLQISYPWLPLVRRAGLREVTVEVAAGETVRIAYTAPLIRYLPGKIEVAERFPSARVVRS